VLISVETTHYYSLNSTGSVAWRVLLEGPQTADSIAATLASHHGLDRTEVRTEVSALLEQLSSEGLVRVEEGSEPSSAGSPAALDGNGTYVPPSLLKYDALERLVLSGE
jgi:hypothetical protein